jgi:hypothetical protein
MQLIFKINEQFIKGQPVYPKRDPQWLDQYKTAWFETFNLVEEQRQDLTETHRGSATQLEQYFHAFDIIWVDWHLVFPQTKHMITIALLYDFMAFISHYLLSVCGPYPKESVIEKTRLQSY